MDTSGFYKHIQGRLLYGPNFVLNADYTLERSTHETHTYPVDGWYWFETEEEAKTFFGV